MIPWTLEPRVSSLFVFIVILKPVFTFVITSNTSWITDNPNVFLPGLDLSLRDNLYHGFLPDGGFQNIFLDSNQIPNINVLQGPPTREKRQGPIQPGAVVALPFPPPRPDLTQVVLPYVKQKEGYIQGTGYFQCFLQATFYGNEFVESVGYYRATFRGARKIKGFVEGIGYYQLIYQKPGQLQEFIQGFGIYQCNFEGVRHFHGFVTSMGQPIVQTRGGTAILYVDPGVAQKTAYVDITAQYFSNLGNISKSYNKPGSFQILGNYQHDIDGLGQHPDFASIQALEFYNLDLTILDLGLHDEQNYRQLDYLSQQGEIQLSTQGSQLPQSLLNYLGNLGYNFRYNITKDESFFVFVGRYDYNSEESAGYPNLDYAHNHDFIQAVGSYTLGYPFGESSGNQSHIQAIATYQFDYPLRQPDFLQLAVQYDQVFPGLDADVIAVEILATYQKAFPLGYAKEFIQIIGRLSYTLQGEGLDSGFFQLFGFYDYFPTSIQDSNGYLQYLSQYAFIYQGTGNLNHFDVQIQLQYQYNFPDDTPYAPSSHGYVKVLGKWKVDLVWLGLEKRGPSFLQFVMVYQCNFKGRIFKSDKMCFVQIYTLYQGDVDAIYPESTAYVQLVGEYYSEL